MSAESTKQVVSRAVADRAFRALLFRDPAQALAGYELTEAESAGLRSMSAEQFDAASAELEQRISKSGISIAKSCGSGSA